MPVFRIGINMAGAISAGAYTAGVLDFLTEALDEWYKAKAAGAAVPSHDIQIEVISGASAGGMCAAISAIMLQEDFQHIHDTTQTETSNRFYESWVNSIDIRELLKTDDLRKSSTVVSLLDSSIIDKIASYALTPDRLSAKPRPYLSPDLTLFLTLTNLRGVPYSLNGEAPGSTEETTFFYGDRICFKTVRSDSERPVPTTAHPIPFAQSDSRGDWDLLRTAAMATGAFPIFLAPRVLSRRFNEYCPATWETAASKIEGTPPPTAPNFPPDLSNPFQTLNVDGGVTNNDPYNYANDFLHSDVLPPAPPRDPKSKDDRLTVDRAVIGIAPFPTTEEYRVKFSAEQRSGIFSALPNLFSALISQSRFFGESLSAIMTGTTFSRFVIAPSDHELVVAHEEASCKNPRTVRPQPPALQCATLGAFGGFFERAFRAHDYALGRRNCQKFLCDSFLLPIDNVIMKAALDGLDPDTMATVLRNFQRPQPGPYVKSDERKPLAEGCGPIPPFAAANSDASPQIWLPLIPLCSPKVTTFMPPIPRARMSNTSLTLVRNLILQRFKVLISHLLSLITSPLLRTFLKIGQPFIRFLAKRPLKNVLIKQLGDAYDPNS